MKLSFSCGSNDFLCHFLFFSCMLSLYPSSLNMTMFLHHHQDECCTFSYTCIRRMSAEDCMCLQVILKSVCLCAYVRLYFSRVEYPNVCVVAEGGSLNEVVQCSGTCSHWLGPSGAQWGWHTERKQKAAAFLIFCRTLKLWREDTAVKTCRYELIVPYTG